MGNRDVVLGQPAGPVPAPLPHEVLLAHPNRDGSRKACRNCAMFVRDDGGTSKCMIHPRSLEVLDRYWCGYHVEGAPLATWMDHPGGLVPVDPRLSGLRVAGGGISCDTCVWFQAHGPNRGICLAVADPKTGVPPAPVLPLMVCRRHKPL